MSPSELAELRRALVARLREILRAARHDESLAEHENAVEADPKDDSDDAILNELDGIQGELGDREAHEAEVVVAALHRMRTGDYGRCVDCGNEIPFARLKAISWAERCAEDQALFDGAAPRATL